MKKEPETAAERLQLVMADPSQLTKRFSFGAVIGGITGMSFALLDGFRGGNGIPFVGDWRKSAGLLSAGSVAKTTSLFSVFFGVYHASKYTMEQARNADDPVNVFGAAAVAFTPMIPYPWMRSRMPYGVLLIAMDFFNTQIMNREPDT